MTGTPSDHLSEHSCALGWFGKFWHTHFCGWSGPGQCPVLQEYYAAKRKAFYEKNSRNRCA